MVTLEDALAVVENLSPVDKIRLIERLAASVEQEMPVQGKEPLDSLYGICADLGPAPSAEEIDEARKEMWSGFPREDFFK